MLQHVGAIYREHKIELGDEEIMKLVEFCKSIGIEGGAEYRQIKEGLLLCISDMYEIGDQKPLYLYELQDYPSKGMNLRTWGDVNDYADSERLFGPIENYRCNATTRFEV